MVYDFKTNPVTQPIHKHDLYQETSNSTNGGTVTKRQSISKQ